MIAAFNDGLIRPVAGEGRGNLDASNDYLSWPTADSYKLTILGRTVCCLHTDPQKAPDGRPMMDVVAEVLQDNQQAELILM
mgnify:CR=1 FL=1